MSVVQTIPWVPHAKQRPRVTKQGVAYTPAPTKQAEDKIRKQWKELVDTAPPDGPVKVTIMLSDDEFTIAVEDTAEHENRKLRGDIDNYAKTILDALNGHAWVDDKQIVDLRVVKV